MPEHMTENAEAKHEDAEPKRAEELKFLGLVSHEFKTPLNAIIGFSQMMRSELFGKLGAPEYSEFAEAIQTSGEKLLRLVDELIAASSAQIDAYAVAESHVDILRVITETVESTKPLAAQRGQTFEILADAVPVAVWADPATLRQALAALVDNAVKFSPEGAVITAGLDIDDAGDVVAWIKDQGPGFPDGSIDSMRALFIQADGAVNRSYEGLGVGLYLCHRLIELNDGALELSNTEDAGALVALRLPKSRRIDIDAEDDLTVMDDDGPLEDDAEILEISHDDQRFHIFPNGVEFVIGRHGSRGDQRAADLCVSDRRASRYHAQIVASQGAFFLVDESSRGTYVTPDGGDAEFVHRSVSQPITGEGVISLGDPADAEGVATLRYRLRQPQDVN